METDAQAVRNSDECMFLNKLEMIVLGVWPVDSKALRLRIIDWKVRIVYFSMSFLLCVQWYDIYSLWGNDDAISEILLTNALIFAIMIKLSSFLKHMDTFREILLTMRANWSRAMQGTESHNKDIMCSITAKARSRSNTYLLVVGVTSIFYIIMPFLKDNPSQNRNYPFFGRYYFDRDSNIIYVLCYLSQVLTGMIIGLANYVTDTMFLVCTYHFCAQLQILQNDLMDLGHENYLDGHSRLATLIKRHQAEIRNAHLLQLIFSQSSLQQVLLSCLMICVNGFKLIASFGNQEINVVMYFMSVMLSLLQILCYCQPGNELIIQSQSLDEAIYHSGWTDMDKNSIKSLMFMMHRSQKPLSVIAGQIYVLSLQNFMRIVKTAVSGLSVLQAIYRRND